MDIARTLRTVARSSVAAWDAPADRKAALLAECDRAAHAVAAVADACAKGDLFPWEVADAARGMLGALALLTGDNQTGREGEMVDARTAIGCPFHVQRCAETVRRVADGWLTSRKATPGEMPRQRRLSGPMRSFMVREEPETEQRIRRLMASEAASVDWYHVTERMGRGPYGSTEITVRVVVPWSAEGEPAGDAGGPGDSLIAQAARGVTGETDPLKVAKQIAGMVPRSQIETLRHERHAWSVAYVEMARAVGAPIREDAKHAARSAELWAAEYLERRSTLTPDAALAWAAALLPPDADWRARDNVAAALREAIERGVPADYRVDTEGRRGIALADYRAALSEVCEALGVSSSRTPIENLPGIVAEHMAHPMVHVVPLPHEARADAIVVKKGETLVLSLPETTSPDEVDRLGERLRALPIDAVLLPRDAYAHTVVGTADDVRRRGPCDDCHKPHPSGGILFAAGGGYYCGVCPESRARWEGAVHPRGAADPTWSPLVHMSGDFILSVEGPPMPIGSLAFVASDGHRLRLVEAPVEDATVAVIRWTGGDAQLRWTRTDRKREAQERLIAAVA